MALTLESGARDLVIRARSGDQNAMGMIAEIRKKAATGHAKAKAGFEAIHAYIRKNPTAENKARIDKDSTIGSEASGVLRDLHRNVKRSGSSMGAEGDATSEAAQTCYMLLALPKMGGERALNAATVTLANGPQLTDGRIRAIGNAIPNEDARRLLFKFIIAYCVNGQEEDMPAQLLPYVKAGQCIGQARTLQMLRMPATPIAKLNSLTAYELGEMDNRVNAAMNGHIQQYHAPSGASGTATVQTSPQVH
jgi:hypothetical protein